MRTTLNAVLVTPLTGSLARYGRQTAAALELWAEKAVDLPPPWTGVDLEVHDAQPDPVRTVYEVVGPRTHVLFGPYGSGPTIKVAAATDRLVWNHGGATSRLSWDRFPHVVNVLSPASSYYEGTLRAIAEAALGASSVVVFHAQTGFAADVATGAAETGEGLGYDVELHPFEPGTAYDEAWSVPDADVLLVAGNFSDERSAAEVLLKRSWRAAGFVAAGVEDVLEPLGSAREGLFGPAQWSARVAPEPDLGPDASWFVREYLRRTGDEPAYPAAQAFAAGLLAARSLSGGIDDRAVLGAAKRLSTTTLYGRFDLDPRTGLQSGHRVITVQWQDDRRRVVWPPEQAEAPARRARG